MVVWWRVIAERIINLAAVHARKCLTAVGIGFGNRDFRGTFLLEDQCGQSAYSATANDKATAFRYGSGHDSFRESDCMHRDCGGFHQAGMYRVEIVADSKQVGSWRGNQFAISASTAKTE